MKVSNEKHRSKLVNNPLYTIYINCSPEITLMVDKHFENRPDDESKIKFLELLEIRDKCTHGTSINIKIILNFLIENKGAFKKYIDLFNCILCLKSHLTDEDIKNDIPSSHIYFYDLGKTNKLQTIKMIDEVSYIFYHSPEFEIR